MSGLTVDVERWKCPGGCFSATASFLPHYAMIRLDNDFHGTPWPKHKPDWEYPGDSLAYVEVDWLFSACVAFLEVLEHVSVLVGNQELYVDARKLRSEMSYHHSNRYKRPFEGWLADGSYVEKPAATPEVVLGVMYLVGAYLCKYSNLEESADRARQHAVTLFAHDDPSMEIGRLLSSLSRDRTCAASASVGWAEIVRVAEANWKASYEFRIAEVLRSVFGRPWLTSNDTHALANELLTAKRVTGCQHVDIARACASTSDELSVSHLRLAKQKGFLKYAQVRSTVRNDQYISALFNSHEEFDDFLCDEAEYHPEDNGDSVRDGRLHE